MLAIFKRNSESSLGVLLKTDINLLNYSSKEDIENMEWMLLLKQHGYHKVLNATDHDPPGVEDTFHQLHTENVRLYTVNDAFLHKIKSNSIVPYKGEYVFIKVGSSAPYALLEETIFQLCVQHLKPVLVQAERYTYLQNNFQHVRRVLSRSCLLEIDLISLTGHFGPEAKVLAEKLLKEKVVHFIGTGILLATDEKKMTDLLYSKKLHKLLSESPAVRNHELG